MALENSQEITQKLSISVLLKFIPYTVVDAIMKDKNLHSKRNRKLPMIAVVYYVIALCLFMRSNTEEVLKCLTEGRWKLFKSLRSAVKSALSKARQSLGFLPFKILHDTIIRFIGTKETKGVFYQDMRVLSIDGSILHMVDTKENAQYFTKPQSTSEGPFPTLRFVGLVESGTHVIKGSEMAPFALSEYALGKKVLEEKLPPNALLLGDRLYGYHEIASIVSSRNSDFLLRVRKSIKLKPTRILEDGSYISHLKSKGKESLKVRVIEYKVKSKKDEVYRLVTSLLDPKKYKAIDLVRLYHERWEHETTLDELKTHLKDQRTQLRSKKPELVKQEFYALLLAHYAIRGMIHEAALASKLDPDDLSYTNAVSVIKRKVQALRVFSPSVTQKMSQRNFT